MAEYIEREAAIKAIEKADYTLIANDADSCKADYLREIIESVPAADVVPVVHGRWIPVTERLPEPETEVMIVCNRNGYRFIATAIHEDGTLLTEGSKWNWNEIWVYGRYDEEHDDYIIPEGWWESRCFTPDDVYNFPVDCEVTHWMPMPELPEEKNDGDK